MVRTALAALAASATAYISVSLGLAGTADRLARAEVTLVRIDAMIRIHEARLNDHDATQRKRDADIKRFYARELDPLQTQVRALGEAVRESRSVLASNTRTLETLTGLLTTLVNRR